MKFVSFDRGAGSLVVVLNTGEISRLIPAEVKEKMQSGKLIEPGTEIDTSGFFKSMDEKKDQAAILNNLAYYIELTLRERQPKPETPRN